jgi:hypothetical protein
MKSHNMPNNILIGSEKLFRTRAPWRINKSLLGQMTNDHDVILFNHDKEDTPHLQKAKEIGKILYEKQRRHYDKVIFIGIGSDCRIAAELAWLGFNVDAAAFINNVHSPSNYDHMFDHTAIYNFYTSQDYKFLKIEGAECNQFVQTSIPAHMSTRLATEIAACITYQTYEVTHLNKTPGRFLTIK